MITSVINGRLNLAIWRKGDTVTICNTGGNCTTFVYNGFGNWLSKGYSPDNGVRYPDKVGRKIADSTGGYTGCNYTTNYMMTFHYEWDDYYSDGNYIGSSYLNTILDGLVPLNSHCA